MHEPLIVSDNMLRKISIFNKSYKWVNTIDLRIRLLIVNNNLFVFQCWFIGSFTLNICVTLINFFKVVVEGILCTFLSFFTVFVIFPWNVPFQRCSNHIVWWWLILIAFKNKWRKKNKTFHTFLQFLSNYLRQTLWGKINSLSSSKPIKVLFLVLITIPGWHDVNKK